MTQSTGGGQISVDKRRKDFLLPVAQSQYLISLLTLICKNFSACFLLPVGVSLIFFNVSETLLEVYNLYITARELGKPVNGSRAKVFYFSCFLY